jgi:hypothetical protein
VPTITTVVQLRSVNGWMTIFSRVDSSFPLSQPATAYNDGFGDVATNFWLGVNKIYCLTNRAVNGGLNYRLRIEMQTQETNE